MQPATKCTTTLATAGNLASTLQKQGKETEAEPLVHATLAIQQRVLGEGHLNTLNTGSNLAQLPDNNGQHARG